MEYSDLKINQGILFHSYNWILPLLVPFVAILFIGLYLKISSVTLLMTLIAQISFYNVVIMSTNIGLLSPSKSKNNFNDKNIAFSILAIVFSMFIFILSLIINFISNNKIDFYSIIMMVFAIILSYFSVLLLSKNTKSPFRKNVFVLSSDREKVNKDSVSNILKGEDKDE